MTDKISLILIGAGNMGGALFNAWANSDVLNPARSAVIDPNPTDATINNCERASIPLNPVEDKTGYDVCVLGVKPQLFPAVLPTLDWPSFENTLFVSIAAGTNIETIAQLLGGGEKKIIRTMPNLPASVGRGMSLLTAGDGVSQAQRDAVQRLFETAGAAIWTKNEDQLDRLMGVSGCGPAFVFHFVEALQAAAIDQGANPEDARLLGEMTVIGAARQLEEEGRPAADLRAAVTSKGGTTHAGLEVLMKDDSLISLMKNTVTAAYKRAKELGS